MYNADIQYSRVYVAVSPRFSPLTYYISILSFAIHSHSGAQSNSKRKGESFLPKTLGKRTNFNAQNDSK